MNDIARVKMRPSSSGSTTFIARSLGASPRAEPSHAEWAEPARATCSTEQSAASSTVDSSSRRAEKAVALTMTAGAICSINADTEAAAAGSFRLVTATANGSRPSDASAAIIASIGAVSAASRLAR